MCLFIEGRGAREERELERVAWHACNVMNALGVKPKQTVKRLLRRDRVIDNDVAAALISGMIRDPKTAKEADKLSGEQVKEKVSAFRAMMRVKTAEARAANRAKKRREAEERRGSAPA